MNHVNQNQDDFFLSKNEVNHVLFQFLSSIYHFEKREQNQFGVNWDEVFLLQLLKKYPETRITTLADKMNVKAFVTSRMVKRLEKLNYVEKRQSDGDRRVYRVSITSEGKSLLEAIEAYNYETIMGQIHHFDPETVASMLQTLKRLDLLLNVSS